MNTGERFTVNGATASRKRLPAAFSFHSRLLKQIFLGLLAAGAMLLPARAQETNAAASLQLKPTGIWVDDVVGNGFRRGVKDAGFAVGGGVSAPRVGNKTLHDLVLAKFHYGWMMSDVKARDKWYGGNWELLEEIFGGGQTYPAARYLIGETTLLRYSLATGTRWVPFADGGIGILATDIANPDLGSTFEFNAQGGLGVNYFMRDNLAMCLQYRFTHYSNAGTRSPNQGVNDHVFYLGMSWFF